ncbi:MAG: efflux RND transporter periplasmic adaptor subunit [Nitrospirae bacterium]|nr:efflux RND transporter periplasmic adaptor subunit [Nitrospirota bacterium]
MKKMVIILSAVAAAVIIFIIFSAYFKDKGSESIRKSGIVQGTEVNITSNIPGKIAELCCSEGENITAGSVAASIDSDDLKAATEQADASVQRAIADIKTSEANIETAKARLVEAKLDKERMTSLFQESLVPRAKFDSSEANLNSAAAIHKASVSQLASSKARLKEAEAMFSQQKARLNDTIITTPISGVVVFKALEKGEFVSPGITIYTIVDMEDLWVRIDVEESLIGMINIGDNAVITTDAKPDKKIEGRVSEIGRYAEFATQRDVKHGTQDIKTFHLKIYFTDTERFLKPGMTVNVEIPSDKQKIK